MTEKEKACQLAEEVLKEENFESRITSEEFNRHYSVDAEQKGCNWEVTLSILRKQFHDSYWKQTFTVNRGVVLDPDGDDYNKEFKEWFRMELKYMLDQWANNCPVA